MGWLCEYRRKWEHLRKLCEVIMKTYWVVFILNSQSSIFHHFYKIKEYFLWLLKVIFKKKYYIKACIQYFKDRQQFGLYIHNIKCQFLVKLQHQSCKLNNIDVLHTKNANLFSFGYLIFIINTTKESILCRNNAKYLLLMFNKPYLF